MKNNILANSLIVSQYLNLILKYNTEQLWSIDNPSYKDWLAGTNAYLVLGNQVRVVRNFGWQNNNNDPDNADLIYIVLVVCQALYYMY